LSLLFYFVLFAGLSLVTLAHELNFVLASLNEKCALHVLKKEMEKTKWKRVLLSKKLSMWQYNRACGRAVFIQRIHFLYQQ
jgi:hypothetical protein